MTSLNNQTIIIATEKHGTPLYLYDGSQLRTTYRKLRAALPNQVAIFYSMKANPTLGICQLLNQEQSGCEVCSAIELLTALRANFSPKNIIFVGPGKSHQELELGVAKKIYAIVCESLNELVALDNIARQANTKCSVLLRINPNFVINKAPLKMGGLPTQFGMDLASLHNHSQQILSLKNIKILGIHVYNGTRLLDANLIIENIKKILNLAKELSSSWQIAFKCIDIGGGLGIPYFTGENALDINLVTTEVTRLTNEFRKSFPDTSFILECGRFLVGESGILVGKVLDIKNSHQETFLITDVGMNCHLAATGIASFIKRNFPISSISGENNHKKTMQAYNITGPLCTPGDLIAKQIVLPNPKVGDLIIIHQAGAYGLTASPGRFLSHGYPAEVIVDGNQIHLLRNRETVTNILSQQFSLPLQN